LGWFLFTEWTLREHRVNAVSTDTEQQSKPWLDSSFKIGAKTFRPFTRHMTETRSKILTSSEVIRLKSYYTYYLLPLYKLTLHIPKEISPVYLLCTCYVVKYIYIYVYILYYVQSLFTIIYFMFLWYILVIIISLHSNIPIF